ncbi:MAG TPA: type III-A CRISPR-associated RAMP protein Csm3 [Chloroflexota bacterium]|nr:type III-A CRISPR-associated RAMP protein Csm3 [Chloroflexota bacterium]HZU07469.1 type III-A CRISPR-associated RAMP protein Csm3 [Chloroflexota bacterium]
MANGNRSVTLYGRVFLQGAVEVVTGLHIGGAAGPLAIGGVDSPVIRDVLTNRPYLPGSSLKGKLRSLVERAHGVEQNQRIGQGVFIHVCKAIDRNPAAYRQCAVCPIFGVPGESEPLAPTRLVVRDVYLDEASARRLEQARTDFPFTEIKWEAAIDRVTSAATPRQIERVPAGAVFQPFELIYSIYEAEDLARFRTLANALQLLEDDYLGGLGSRGGGKVRFTDLRLFAKARETYALPEELRDVRQFASVERLLAELDDVVAWLGREISVG